LALEDDPNTGSPPAPALSPLQSSEIAYFWDTAGVAEGNYTLEATTEIIASAFQFKTPLPGAESNYTNNARNGKASIELQLHNVAVHSVEVTPTVIKLGQTPIIIDVTVQNLGTFPETFDVAVYYNSTLIENRTGITLPEQSNTTLTFTWNTASVPIGKYRIVANISSVPGEAVPEDNSKAFPGMVIISNAPIADFTYTPEHPRKGEAITFDGTSSSDPDGTVDKWFWDFGDDTGTSTGIMTTHTFTEVRTFNVTLTVADNNDLNSSVSKQVVVDKTLSVTTLEVSANTTTLGRSISLSGSISPSPGVVSVTLNYRIQGAQEWATLAVVQTNTTGYFSYPSWTPSTVNIYQVRATWEGTAEIQGAPSEIVEITVNKAPSQVTCTANPKTVPAGTKVTISGTVTATMGTTSTPIVGVTVTVYVQATGQAEAAIGTAVTNANGAYTLDYTPPKRGVYQVRASWNGDDNTLSATSEWDVITVNEPPGGDYTLYIIAGAVAIIVIIAIAIYFLKLRK
jgi:PKD repeat protein